MIILFLIFCIGIFVIVAGLIHYFIFRDIPKINIDNNKNNKSWFGWFGWFMDNWGNKDGGGSGGSG